MTRDERAIERLRNPKPGGKIWAAREYGVDLTLLIEQLRRTTEQRSRDLEGFMHEIDAMRAARKSR